MGNPVKTPPLARAVARDLFGALLGVLASTAVARLLLLAYEVPEIILVVLLLVGAASGAFATHYGSRSAETVVVAFRTWNTRLRRISLKAMLWMLAPRADPLSTVTGTQMFVVGNAGMAKVSTGVAPAASEQSLSSSTPAATAAETFIQRESCW